MLVALTAVAGCSAQDPIDTTSVSADRCVIRVHGKGSSGAPPRLIGDVAILAPDGNGIGWDARVWEYSSAESLRSGARILETSADEASCSRVVLHGFSNGASMVVAYICSGADLDGRLVGSVIDDPVTDTASVGCSAVDRPIAVYWTGALDLVAPPGTACADVDWTCAGTTVRGIDAFTADLGVDPTPSPYDTHRWFVDTALPLTWLG